MPGKYPIIYVAGFAGTTRDINTTTDDPFYGFNRGSTHVRIDGHGDPIFYEFESALLRLISELGYQVLVEGGQEKLLERSEPGTVPPESVWIHRFYDRSADTWQARGATSGDAGDVTTTDAVGNSDLATPEPFMIEQAAEDLLRLVEAVRSRTGAPKVHLVAHSMGGLICRSMIQRVIPDRHGVREGPAESPKARDLVDRLFTYGTPHGGISFKAGLGLLDALRDEFGPAGSDIFGRRRMYEYLTPLHLRQADVPEDWDPRRNPDPDNFPTERIFCLVGTNPEDYQAKMGLSARMVGTESDGLVRMENASVYGSRRAYVHRSHSGRYGLVNSEEGYQNLIRFLFGDVVVTTELVGLRLPDDPDLSWQAEARVAVRGLPVVLHEQLAAHHCPIPIGRPYQEAGRPEQAVPLVTTFLWSACRRPHAPMRYTLQVRLLSLKEKDGVFFWRDHIEQIPDFDDILVIDVVQEGDSSLAAWAAWASDIEVPIKDYQPTDDPLRKVEGEEGGWCARVGLPKSGAFLGPDAAVKLTAAPVE